MPRDGGVSGPVEEEEMEVHEGGHKMMSKAIK